MVVTTRAGASATHPNKTRPAPVAAAAPPAASAAAVSAARARKGRTPDESASRGGGGGGGFRVPYEVRPSTIAGRGVFALEPIVRGTLVWEYVVGTSVLEYDSESEMRARLSRCKNNDEARDVLEHVYVWKGCAVEIIDDAKIWNHTPKPNTGYHPDDPDVGEGLGSYALRDIEAGEELTDDYGDHHDLPWFEGLCKEYEATSCTDLGRKIR